MVTNYMRLWAKDAALIQADIHASKKEIHQ